MSPRRSNLARRLAALSMSEVHLQRAGWLSIAGALALAACVASCSTRSDSYTSISWDGPRVGLCPQPAFDGGAISSTPGSKPAVSACTNPGHQVAQCWDQVTYRNPQLSGPACLYYVGPWDACNVDGGSENRETYVCGSFTIE